MASNNKYLMILLTAGLVLGLILTRIMPVSSDTNTTDTIKITKYADNGKTINAEISLTYEWLRDNLPVEGDGKTHYFHQGIVNVEGDNETTRWNEAETENFYDFGAVQGTRLDILCDLVGGMKEGDTLITKGKDNWKKTFAYKNVYDFSSREGPMVLTWSKDGMYPESGYDEGMRVVWFASDYGRDDGKHVFGNWDWHEAADEEYWYYYQQNPGSPKYPTTTGLSGKYISDLIIHSSDPPFWDPNGDGSCDEGDVEDIGAQWHKKGKPYWIPEDINGDGIVNILDAVKVGMHWGKSN
jgi:hypothetical protein